MVVPAAFRSLRFGEQEPQSSQGSPMRLECLELAARPPMVSCLGSLQVLVRVRS